MNVGKWGNSLAVRLPKEIVEALDVKEGDAIRMVVTGKGHVELTRDTKREEALRKLEALCWPLPPGFKFDREEAHERR